MTTAPGIIVGSNIGDGHGGGETFSYVYTATQDSTKPFAYRQYGSPHIFPTTFYDSVSLGQVMTNATPPVLQSGYPNVSLVLSWKPDYSTTVAGGFDSSIVAWAHSCQAYHWRAKSSVNPWPILVSLWHEGEQTIGSFTTFKAIHAYVYPIFKAACTAYNSANGHSGGETVPYGAIMEGWEGKNIIQFFPAPSTTLSLPNGVAPLTSMLDFYTFDNYLMGAGNAPTATPAAKLQWGTLISNLDIPGRDTYPNLGYTECNVAVGDNRLVGGVPFYNSAGNQGPCASPYATDADRDVYFNRCWSYTNAAYYGNGQGFTGGYQGHYPGLFLTFWSGRWVESGTNAWHNTLAWNNATDTNTNANTVVYGAAWSSNVTDLKAISTASYAGGSTPPPPPPPPPTSDLDTYIGTLIGSTGEFWPLDDLTGTTGAAVNGHTLSFTSVVLNQIGLVPTDAETSVKFTPSSTATSSYQPTFTSGGVTLGIIAEWGIVPTGVQTLLSSLDSNNGGAIGTDASGFLSGSFGNGTTTATATLGIQPAIADDVLFVATWGPSNLIKISLYNITAGTLDTASTALTWTSFSPSITFTLGATTLSALCARAFVLPTELL